MSILSEKERLTLRANLAKKAAAHKAEPMPARHTAGDSKIAKPIKNAPIDYSRARRTDAPTPVEVAAYQRLKLAPDPRYPRVSSAPPGVDPDTGKAWGAAA